MGALGALGTLMSNCLSPFGFNASEIAFIVMGLQISGIIGGISVGVITDRTKKFKQALLTLITMVGVSLIVSIITLTWFSENLLMVVSPFFIYGMSITGYIPTCYTYGAELTFPL